MKPVHMLNRGDWVRPRFEIRQERIRHWKYAAECASIGGGMTTSAILTVVETNPAPGEAWVRLELPGRSPPGHLKVSGEELAGCFEVLAN